MPYNILNEVMDTAIARGSKSGPTWKRIKAYTEGDALKQRFLWSRGKILFDLSLGIKRQADFEKIRALYWVVFGLQYDGFLVRDWGDYTLGRTTSSLTGIGGGDYRVNRRYTTPGGTTYNRPLTRLRAGLLVFDAGGSPLTATPDPDTGIVAVSGGTPSYCRGEFYVAAQFTDDSLENIELDGNEDAELQGLPSIPVEELREALVEDEA